MKKIAYTILSVFCIIVLMLGLYTPAFAASFSTTSVTLNVGETKTITYNNSNATISNSNNNIAKISTSKSGNNKIITIRGVSGGTCKLTASGSSNSVSVTVKEKIKSITINGSSEVNVGHSINLSTNISPINASNKTVSWSSSNNSIAKVNGGTVTGLAAGSVTITAKAEDGSGVIGTKTIHVTSLVDNISLNKKNVTLNKGNTIVLSATISPNNASNKSVSWKSSNTKVATVSSTGIVTAVGPGTCTITCTSNSNSSKKDNCSVKVNDNSVKTTTRKNTTKKQTTANRTEAKTTSSTTTQYTQHNNTRTTRHDNTTSRTTAQNQTLQSNTTNRTSVSGTTNIVANETITTQNSTQIPTTSIEPYTVADVDIDGNIQELNIQSKKGEPLVFSWDSKDKVSGYELYISTDDSEYFMIYNGSDSIYSFAGYRNKTNYNVKIRAYVYDQNDNITYFNYSKVYNFVTPGLTLKEWFKQIFS